MQFSNQQTAAPWDLLVAYHINNLQVYMMYVVFIQLCQNSPVRLTDYPLTTNTKWWLEGDF